MCCDSRYYRQYSHQRQQQDKTPETVNNTPTQVVQLQPNKCLCDCRLVRTHTANQNDN